MIEKVTQKKIQTSKNMKWKSRGRNWGVKQYRFFWPFSTWLGWTYLIIFKEPIQKCTLFQSWWCGNIIPSHWVIFPSDVDSLSGALINTIKREGVLKNLPMKVVWTLSFISLFFWSYFKFRLTICYHIFL